MNPGKDILTDLKGENNYAFGELYSNYFGMVNRFVVNNNGASNDEKRDDHGLGLEYQN